VGGGADHCKVLRKRFPPLFSTKGRLEQLLGLLVIATFRRQAQLVRQPVGQSVKLGQLQPQTLGDSKSREAALRFRRLAESGFPGIPEKAC